MIRKPLVLKDGHSQQLQAADELGVETDVERIERLFHKLLVSCAIQGIDLLDDELQAEFELAMAEYS